MRPFALAAVLATACSPDFALPADTAAHQPAVSVEPLGSIEAAPAVLRLRVQGGVGRSALADFRFFSGTLGAYHVGRIRKRDLPATLLEREIPVLAWADGRDVLVAPLATLASGPHSLATPELGLAVEVTVDPALVPVAERAWPAPGETAGAGTAIFCGEAAAAAAEGPAELAPAGVPASVVRGLDDAGAFSERCVRVQPSAAAPPGTPLLPPALSGGVALEPRLLVLSQGEAEPPSCADGELALGPVCGNVGDDRIELRAPAAPAFVAFEEPSVVVGAVSREKSLVVRGFEPNTPQRLRGLVFDAFGVETSVDLAIHTAPARTHLVLNEVLANPAGSETTSEWIEIVNDGSRSVSLEGFVLDDAIEAVPLPPGELAPGALALLVAESYAPDPELDVAPAPDVPLLVLPRLGRGGLANTGELLRLRDPAGNVVSRFPARSAPGAGTSVARRAPDAPDGEAASFAPHAAPGASPGAENVVQQGD